MVVASKKKPAAKAGKGRGIRTRAAAEGPAAAAPSPAAPPRPSPSVGQLTSHIGNKQARGAVYAKLKHKAAVS